MCPITHAEVSASGHRTPARTSNSKSTNPRWTAEYHEIGGSRRKQADCDHTHDLVDRVLKGHGVGDTQIVHVEDVIAVVGDDLLPPHGAAAQAHELVMHIGTRHRD